MSTQPRYQGANHTYLSELLSEREGIDIGRTTLRRILLDAGLSSPRRRRPPKHRVRRQRMPRAGLIRSLNRQVAFLLNASADISPELRQPQPDDEPPMWSTLPPPFTPGVVTGNYAGPTGTDRRAGWPGAAMNQRWWAGNLLHSELRKSEQSRDSHFSMLRQVYAPLLIRFTEPETHGVLQHQQDYAGHDE